MRLQQGAKLKPKTPKKPKTLKMSDAQHRPIGSLSESISPAPMAIAPVVSRRPEAFQRTRAGFSLHHQSNNRADGRQQWRRGGVLREPALLALGFRTSLNGKEKICISGVVFAERSSCRFRASRKQWAIAIAARADPGRVDRSMRSAFGSPKP